MIFKYLGTAAAESFPAMFCTCDTCQRAFKSGGKNIRTRSQAIIDNTLLIDFPADTYYHIIKEDLKLQNIYNCLITHNHSDHLYVGDLENRKVGFAKPNENTVFNIYGSQIVCNNINYAIKKYGLDINDRVKANCVEAYQTFKIDKYNITALPADHDPLSGPYVYLINDNKSTILYAHDTGMFKDEVWNWFNNNNIKLDFVSLDCTAGLLKGWVNHHLSLDTCVRFIDKLKQLNIVTDKTKVCLNHFSHNCLADYDEMLIKSKPYGFDVSYDGKIITI